VVVDRIRGIARDKELGAEVVRQARTLAEQEVAELNAERRDLERELARHHAELRKLSVEGPASATQTPRLADLHDLITRVETRLTFNRRHDNQR
jgi:hypothetical protein